MKSLKNKKIHLVGIKGTGMTALAEILLFRGSRVTGSDVKEKFYTDAILEQCGIPVTEEFSPANITPDMDLVIYSTAYSADTNPDLLRAAELAIPMLTYPEALGSYSSQYVSAGIAGVHGKTTTTALAGIIAKHLGLPAVILAGSQVNGFENHCTLCLGDKYFIAETCEYKAHFLHFHPSLMIMTSVELDHPDYFHNIDDVYGAFTAYGLRLPENGVLIHNADDTGVCEVVRRIKKEREDINFIPYGTAADGKFRITEARSAPGSLSFRLQGIERVFRLQVPGMHNVSNAAAAVCLCYIILERERGAVTGAYTEALCTAVASFTGSRRRSDILGEAGGILFMDDYAHHPTAVYKTLQGYREFFPHRRLVVDFMSHTYSRTRTLLQEFGTSFTPADEVILHRIYSSAREKNESGISGRALYEEVEKHHPHVHYFDEFAGGIKYLKRNLKEGDLFVTMGAGDNWEVGRVLFRYFSAER